jgi:hypothetical protein
MSYTKITNFAIKDSTNDIIKGTEFDDEFNSIEASFTAQPSATQTLTNKTVALGSNTVSGTTAQFNTALTDGDFATLAGTETLTNKALNGTLGATTPNTGAFTTLSATGNGTIATLTGTGATSYLKMTNTGQTSANGFQVQTVNEDVYVVNYSTAGNIFFSTNGSSNNDMAINAAGGVQHINTISVGNATPSTSGAGITFPATQSASTDANTLDDYEEGTWTPSWSVTGGTWTSSSYVATYTKTGRQVTCSLYWVTSAISGTKVNALLGLPFTSANDSNKYAASIALNTIGATGQILVGQVPANSTNCNMQLSYQDAVTAWGDLVTSAVSATSSITMTITYFV